MIDPAGFIAVGLAGFLAGMAFRGKETLQTMRSAAAAGAFVVDDRAYIVEPMPKDAGDELDFDLTKGVRDAVAEMGGGR